MKKTLEFYEQNPGKTDDEQTMLEIVFRFGYETSFNIQSGNMFYISNSDLQILGKSIIEKLQDTPYKINL